MSTETVTLNLPTQLYKRVHYTAKTLQRPIETLLLETVLSALPLFDDLPPELVDDMVALALLNDAALWQKARSTLPISSQKQLDLRLNEKGEGIITPEGEQELDLLLQSYQKIVLIRAQAAVLLKQRGYDVSDPSVLNTSTESL